MDVFHVYGEEKLFLCIVWHLPVKLNDFSMKTTKILSINGLVVELFLATVIMTCVCVIRAENVNHGLEKATKLLKLISI